MNTNKYVTISILLSSLLVACSDSKVELKGDLPRVEEVKEAPVVIVLPPTSDEIISASKTTLDNNAASQIEQEAAAIEIAKVLGTDLINQRANFDLLTNDEIGKIVTTIHEGKSEDKAKLIFDIIKGYEKIGRNTLVESKITENMTVEIMNELKKYNSKKDFKNAYSLDQLMTLVNSIDSTKMFNQLHTEDQAYIMLEAMSEFKGDNTDYAYFLELRNLERKLENLVSLKRLMQWHHETMTKFEKVQDLVSVQNTLPEMSLELSWFQRRMTGLKQDESKIQINGKLDQALKARSDVYSGNLSIEKYCDTLEALGVRAEVVQRQDMQRPEQVLKLMTTPGCVYTQYDTRNQGKAFELTLKSLNFRANKFTAWIFRDTNLTIESDYFDGPMIDLSADQTPGRQQTVAQPEDKDALAIPMVLRVGVKKDQYQTKEYDLVAHYPIQTAKAAVENREGLMQGYAGGELRIQSTKVQYNAGYAFISKGGRGQMSAETVSGGEASTSTIDLSALATEIEKTKSNIAGSSVEMVTQISYQDLKNILEDKIVVRGIRSSHLYNGAELNEQGLRVQNYCKKMDIKDLQTCLQTLAADFEAYLKDQIKTAETENRMNENMPEFSGATFTLSGGKAAMGLSQLGLNGANGKVRIN